MCEVNAPRRKNFISTNTNGCTIRFDGFEFGILFLADEFRKPEKKLPFIVKWSPQNGLILVARIFFFDIFESLKN